MRMERTLWAAFLIPTLVPELGAGVSPVELLAIVSCLLSGATLMLNYVRAARLPAVIWLIISYLVLSLVGLTHDPINYFSPHFAGGLVFTIAVAVGGCLPERMLGTIVKWFFLLLTFGALLDITRDLMGWSSMAERSTAEFEAGARGLATSRSGNGMFLSSFMAYMVIASPSPKWRVLGACALLLVFYHVVVFGQGRGSTALAVLGMMTVFARELRSLPAALLAMAPVLVLAATGFFDEAMAPFIDRATSQDLSEVDRLHHAQVGEMLVRNMNNEEVLFGMDYRKVIIANGGTGIHNSLFEMLTRYGLFATVPWLAFNVISLVAAGKVLLGREIEREQIVWATVVVQTLISLTVGGIFVNWRSCVLPGVCTGLVLQTFHSEGRAWRHS